MAIETQGQTAVEYNLQWMMDKDDVLLDLLLSDWQMKPVFFFGVYFSNGTSFYLNTDSIENLYQHKRLLNDKPF